MSNHCHIYAIVSSDVQLPEGLTGLQGRHLYIVRHGQVAALVSDGAFELGKDSSLILDLYQKQLEILGQVKVKSLLPTRFGSGLSSLGAIEFLLQRHEALLLEQLQTVAHKVQFHLTARWDLNGEIQTAASNQDVQKFKSDLQISGKIQLEDQARLGELISMHLEHERQRLTDKVLLQLEPMLSEYGFVGRDQEDVAFNIALLAEQALEMNLRATLEKIQIELGARIVFALSAPQVATAFRLLEVIEPRVADLEKARLILRLPSNTPNAPAQIQRAFKQLALERHPDRNPHQPFAAEDMQELSWARELLELAGSGVGVRVQKMVSN